MVIGLLTPTLEVMEGGVETSEISPYIEECILAIIMTVIMATAVKMTERAIEW